MAAKQNIPAQLRLKEIQIQSLKGISNCTITFPADKKVTAIMGMNGSGKSTIINALACCYKPRNATSKENNRFSDFFTPHVDNNWRDSGFTAHFYAGALNNQGNKIIFVPTPAPDDTFTQLYSKVARWQPVYGRRPVKESIYIGLQTLGTLSDDLAASRHAKYTSHVFGPAHLKQKILDSMCRVLEANYSDLMICTTHRGYNFYKFTKNGISYTEHTMGAGEKRVFEVLKAAHDPSILPNGLLLIDELDVLLHEKAFKKLVSELVVNEQTSFVSVCLPLINPVFQYQSRHPLKLPHIIGHQNSAGGNGVTGNRRIIRADRRPGQTQRDLNLRGGVHRGAVPGQDGIEPGAEFLDQMNVTRRGLRAGGAASHFRVSNGRDPDTVAAQHRLIQACPGDRGETPSRRRHKSC